MTRIKSHELGISELQKHPVWTWYYALMEPEDSVVPVELTKEGLAEAEVLMIYSQFRTAAGNEHEGYIIFNPGSEEVFAINICMPGDALVLNVRLPDLAQEALQRYATAKGYSASNVLPIQYRTKASQLNVIAGEFAY